MFVPDGYFYLPEIVTWVAKLGAEGKLPRRLGFIHPEDVTDPLALSAEATARFVLGEILAANAIPAEFIIFPSGLRLPVPAYYWSSESAAATMKTGELDSNVIGYRNDLHAADVILPIDKVTAALGIRLISLPEDSRSKPDDCAVRQSTCRRASEPPAVTGRETKGSMSPGPAGGRPVDVAARASAVDGAEPANASPTIARPRKRARRKAKKTLPQIVCDKLLELHNPDKEMDVRSHHRGNLIKRLIAAKFDVKESTFKRGLRLAERELSRRERQGPKPH